MPFSDPSYFPGVSGNDNVIGINAGLNQNGSRVFLEGLNTGNNNTASDLILLGDSVLTAGNNDANAQYSVIIGSQSFKLATNFSGYSTGPVVAIGGDILPALANGMPNSVLVGCNIYQSLASDAPDFGSNTVIGIQALKNPTAFTTNSARNVVIGTQAAAGIGGASGEFNDNVLVGMNVAYQWNTLLANNTVIGSQAGTTMVGAQNNVFIGSQSANGTVGGGNNSIVGAYSTLGASNSECSGLGANITFANNYQTILGYGANSASDATVNLLLVETNNGQGTKNTIFYGNMSTGNLIVGNSVQGTNRDFAGTSANILKLINGTKGSVNPVGGGYFYVSAGALHWVGSSGTDTTLGNA